MSSDDQSHEAEVRHEPADTPAPFTRPPDRERFVMRYTIIGTDGKVSFVGPCQGLKALVAACAQDTARTAEELLAAAGAYNSDLRDKALNGLHQFDEHNTPGHYDAIHA